MLYLIATPLGNLSDITLRALSVLKECDLILCEDTRYSRRFLSHYAIEKPLKSYHKFNESKELHSILEALHCGKKMALISDAGTPGIADPGSLLISRCIEEKIPLVVLPGPCALIAALSLSGFSSERFQFIGFLPKKEKELKGLLAEILGYSGSSLCYESPHRLLRTLSVLASLSNERRCSVARELTKIHEECLRGNARELREHFQKTPPRGELVLLIEGKAKEEPPSTPLTREEILSLQKEHSLSLQEAIKLVAEIRGLPKREVYQFFHT
jgi:16S rRNA (cytidine1402-2'-O)-methyltransferase